MAIDHEYAIDLSAICVEAAGVSPDMPCAAVYDRFAADPGLPAIAVIDADGAPTGLVHRHAFMLALADVYGRPLFERKPVARLMDRKPTMVDLHVDLAALSSQTLEGADDPMTASFIVTESGRYFGIGSFNGLLRIVTDHLRTQMLETESAKREAEQAAHGKSRFLANMTHELRTPLNGVIGFGQLLESEAHGPLGSPEYKLYAKDIVDSGQHLVAIINDILDLAKIEAGRIELHERFIDLRELTGRSLRMVATLAQQKQIRLRSAPANAYWTVRADERRLQQALVNLLSNAIKFTPKGGEVGIDIGANAGWLWIEVWDEGCGISADDLKRLFKPFEQVNSALNGQLKGTGLGLTITRALMQAHGGEVELKSEIDKGTRATLLLPRSRLLTTEFAWSPDSRVEFIDPPDVDFDEEPAAKAV